MDNSGLARRIRAFRKLKGYTQSELADRTQISITIIGSIERGTRKADDRVLQAIASELNVDLQELKGEGGPKSC